MAKLKILIMRNSLNNVKMLNEEKLIQLLKIVQADFDKVLSR